MTTSFVINVERSIKIFDVSIVIFNIFILWIILWLPIYYKIIIQLFLRIFFIFHLTDIHVSLEFSTDFNHLPNVLLLYSKYTFGICSTKIFYLFSFIICRQRHSSIFCFISSLYKYGLRHIYFNIKWYDQILDQRSSVLTLWN